MHFSSIESSQAHVFTSFLQTHIALHMYSVYIQRYIRTQRGCAFHVAFWQGKLTSTRTLSIIAVPRVVGKRSINNSLVKKFLQKYFELNSSPVMKDRKLIAERLQVSLQSINEWFTRKRSETKIKLSTAVLKKGDWYINAFILKSPVNICT